MRQVTQDRTGSLPPTTYAAAMRRGRAVALALTLTITLGLVACAESAPPVAEGTVPTVMSPATLTDADAAVRVCDLLRAHANGLGRAINLAVTAIDGRSPQDRLTALLDGLAAAEAVSTGHRAALDDLDLAGLPEAEALLAELDAGAALAITALADGRAELDAELDAVADDDVHGRVSQAFNAVERAMSVAEPAIGRYDRRALRVAFLEEPTCRHVIQPFREDPVEGDDG